MKADRPTVVVDEEKTSQKNAGISNIVLGSCQPQDAAWTFTPKTRLNANSERAVCCRSRALSLLACAIACAARNAALYFRFSSQNFNAASASPARGICISMLSSSSSSKSSVRRLAFDSRSIID